MRRTLEDAAAVGNATSRALFFEPRASEGFGYYDGSGWFNMLWVGGYTFETPPPLVTDEGIKPFPATGVRTLHSRTSFLYAATGVTPAMCMRLTGLGSQYLMTVKDADGNRLDGGKTYRVTLPPDIPAARFWSITVMTTRPGRCCRHPSASHAPGASRTPHRRRAPTSALPRDAIRGLARSWWLFLILGILWILFGMFVLSYNVGSLLALAIFAGVTFIMTGINQILTSGRAEGGWRWLFLVGGALSIMAGIIAFVWPGRTLLVISVVLAWFLVFKGIVDIVAAFSNHGRPWWWVTLILGILELLLGIWAVGYPGRSLIVFVNLVGIYAIFYGFTELFAAFDLRGLGHRLDDREATARSIPDRPAGMPEA
jgi:uncharacterized membrane protein HdeD (DUF308 family)